MGGERQVFPPYFSLGGEGGEGSPFLPPSSLPPVCGVAPVWEGEGGGRRAFLGGEEGEGEEERGGSVPVCLCVWGGEDLGEEGGSGERAEGGGVKLGRRGVRFFHRKRGVPFLGEGRRRRG